MSRGIKECRDWRDHHDRPVYTLDDVCPACGTQTIESGPAPYNPNDPYGEYRRRLKRREGT